MDSGVINEILKAAPVFLLIAARALAMIEIAPLLNSDTIPQMAKIALAGFAAYAALPTALISGWTVSAMDLSFVFLIAGEAIIGIIIGFYLTLVFAAFSTAGQFFSLQMGFGASETYDPLAQVENPLMGQYLNLVAMLVFLTVGGFQELFLGGFFRSIQSINILNLVAGREAVITMLLRGLSQLFLDAIVISMPILGTLFLTSLATGLISKAAPQINLLSEGFPISITIAFFLIITIMPFMVEAFSRVVDTGFRSIETLLINIGVPIGGSS
ncbi:flagellar biosynthetic protein FliR [Spirochaetia bacterium]|nr:flagellar biosynthetic protein FliR [Spirochaetia bacterium]